MGSISSESRRRIYDFLKLRPVGVLATIDVNGEPHASVIYFSIDEEFNILFTTKRDTKKHDSLKHNNHAVLVAYEASSQTAAQIMGVAEEITGESDANAAFRGTLRAAMQTSEAGVPPISRLYAGHYVAYRLQPRQIRMAVFTRPEDEGRGIYETIDFAN